jgi:Protein of unknown function (DUF4232)
MRILSAALSVLTAIVLAACGASGGSGAPASSSGGVATVTSTATVTSSTAAGAGSSTASGAATTTGQTTAASGPPPCRAAGLALSFLGQQGATGHGELGFALSNTGAAGCSTIGYPGVQFLDRSGGALPTTPSHTTNDFFGRTAERALTVGPGQSVSFRLGVTHGAGSSAGCTTAYGLQVIAPNDTATLRVQIPGGASECGTTTVSPLLPGDSAYR